MTGTISAGQRDFCEQLVYSITPTWAGPMPADLADKYEPIGKRLHGAARSLLVELTGAGGIDRHKLAPKHTPILDLVDLPGWSMENAYPLTEEEERAREPRAAVEFLEVLYNAQNYAEDAAFRTGLPHSEVIGGFLTRVCQIIESDYVLVPLDFDDDGMFTGERANIAPGLGAAFAQVWEKANR